MNWAPAKCQNRHVYRGRIPILEGQTDWKQIKCVIFEEWSVLRRRTNHGRGLGEFQSWWSRKRSQENIWEMPEESEERSHVCMWEQRTPGRGISEHKSSEMKWGCWRTSQAARRLEKVQEDQVARRWGQRITQRQRIMSVLTGLRGLAFSSDEVGSHQSVEQRWLIWLIFPTAFPRLLCWE